MDIKEAESHIESRENLVNIPGVNLRYYRGGKKEGDGEKTLSPSLRVMIGALACLSTGAEVAREMGLSSKHVTNLAAGMLKQGTEFDPVFKQQVDNAAGKIVDKATSKVDAFLDKIIPQELDSLGLLDKISATKDLSLIVKNMKSGEININAGAGGRVVVMTAPEKKESSYEVLEIEARRV